MLRVPCARFAVVAVGLAAAALPAAAWSQDATTEQRLDRLERDLNMLQRQVYRGAPASAPGGGGAVSVEIRMDRLEAQMRDLTGRVEEVMNQIAQVRRRGGPSDSDAALRSAPGGGPAVASVGPVPPPPAAGSENALPYPRPPADSDAQFPPPAAAPGSSDAPGIPPGTLVPPPAGQPSEAAPAYGTLTPPGTEPPRELASTAAAPRPATSGTLPSGSATEQYNHAFGLLRKADYPAAEGALKAFVAQHPNDAMAGNAQYWLGETYYARRRYLEAASAFAEGYKRYPRGAKAADGLLKLGMALARADQKANACVAFSRLDHDFPHPGAAIKEHANAEKKRLGC